MVSLLWFPSYFVFQPTFPSQSSPSFPSGQGQITTSCLWLSVVLCVCDISVCLCLCLYMPEYISTEKKNNNHSYIHLLSFSTESLPTDIAQLLIWPAFVMVDLVFSFQSEWETYSFYTYHETIVNFHETSIHSPPSRDIWKWWFYVLHHRVNQMALGLTLQETVNLQVLLLSQMWYSQTISSVSNSSDFIWKSLGTCMSSVF